MTVLVLLRGRLFVSIVAAGRPDERPKLVLLCEVETICFIGNELFILKYFASVRWPEPERPLEGRRQTGSSDTIFSMRYV